MRSRAVARRTRAVAAATGVLAALALADGAAGQQPRSGGDDLVYVATYSAVYILDESDLSLEDSIPLTSGIPGYIHLTPDREQFYVRTIDQEHVEVLDLATRRSVDTFTLNRGNEMVRITDLAVHPDERHALLLVRRYTKLPDRWKVGENELLLYDLRGHEVVKTVEMPEGGGGFAFSPDGRELYFFGDEVAVYETEGYTQVDSWDHGVSLDQGMGEFRFGFPETPREEEGWYTGLFNVDDPVHHREILALARVNPSLREVETFTLGPLEIGPRSRVSFDLGPDRTRAYGFHQEVANYQLWTFDLENQRAWSAPLPTGRPRMEMKVSSNGELLYVYNAGNTIDVHDAETLEHLRQVELNADMLREMYVLPRPATRAGAR